MSVLHTFLYICYISQQKYFLKDRLNLEPTNSIPMYTVKRGWTHTHDMNKNVNGIMIYNSHSILPKDLKLPKTDKNLFYGIPFLN